MSKKLTISIPNELHQKLENYREQIAISNVCSQALREAMNTIEIEVQEAKNRFHLLSIEEACSLAFRQGLHWAGHKATPEELFIVCLWEDGMAVSEIIEKSQGNAKIIKLIEDYDDINHFLEEKIIDFNKLLLFSMPSEDDDDEEFAINISELFKPFIKGALTVWREIEDPLKSKIFKGE